MESSEASGFARKYRIIRRLAVGGMGEVYLAQQRGAAGFERLVVVKRLLPELAKRPDFVRQFLDEARVLATLSHPNIVSVLEVLPAGESYAIAMEFVRGVSWESLLAEARARGEQLPLDVVCRLVRDAALGLHYVHVARDGGGEPLNIVHRDVSPNNLMVDALGHVKVVDFGIAKSSNRLSRTDTGTVKGKWSYMPLEQLSGGAVDARADQYSLGVVFWELCTGQSLFDTDDVVRLVKEREVPPPTTSRPDIPPQIEAIICRMLEVEPGERFQTCEDVAAALDGVGSVAETRRVAEYAQPSVQRRLDEITSESPPDDALADDALPASERNGTVRIEGTVSSEPSPSLVDDDGGRDTAGNWFPAGLGTAVVLLIGMGLYSMGSDGDVPEAVPGTPISVAPTAEAPPSGKREPEVPTATPPKAKVRKPRRVRPKAELVSEVGTVNIRTSPWSEVFIDGKSVGTTPIYKHRLPVGRHEIRLINRDAGLKKTLRIQLKPGENLKLSEDLR